MSVLKYRDKHNKVGYLEKPKGSDDYHQVLDFLRGSHLRYALTHNPIIFDSLVKWFWSTASLRAPELGPPAILATIDRTPYTITEDTVRSQLQLGDDEGIEDLPIADIYLGMDNLGYPTEGYLGMVNNISNAKSKLFANMRLNFEGDHMPLLAAMLPPAQAAIANEGKGEAAPDGHTSDPNIASFPGAHESDPDLFTSTDVEDETLGGSLHTTPPRSTPVPPKVSTLESELKAHKLLFMDVVGKLVKKVKNLELKLKTRSRKVVLSDSDQEDGGEPDVDLSALNALANAAVTVDSTKSPGGPSKNPAATTVPTSSSVPAADTILASSGTTPETPSSPVRDVRKGKGVVERIFKKRTKRKPKTNKTEHEMERTKSN
ncbi:hypothetical protein Tco_1478622, partial [Tanacetum coccineum]